MSKQKRLVDFQVFARPSGLAEGEQKSLNEALFSTYEPVRLWLKERLIQAPFSKIAISLADESSSARWHGNVSNAIGICQVTEAVELSKLRAHAGDHQWVLGIVLHALACVARSTGWKSKELEGVISAMSDTTTPWVHLFDGLAQTDTISGVRCVPWLATQPGRTQVGVRFVQPHGAKRDVPLAEEPGPLYLEDSFAMANSVIRGSEYILLNAAGKVLASVPIDKAAFN